MFTGIIEKVCPIVYWSRKEEEAVLVLDTGYRDLKRGESIAINGVCLTLTECTPQGQTFYVSPETLRCTNFRTFKKGTPVNVERSLCLGSRLSGHWVQGHVDGVGAIAKLEPKKDSYDVAILVPKKLLPYCVAKGSIAINGVSLTIHSILNEEVNLQIVPHTWEHTNFSGFIPQDLVNIETDILAKYLERQWETYKKP